MADWGSSPAGQCGVWPPEFGDDTDCLTITSSSQFLGALLRGGSYLEAETYAGPFATRANRPISTTIDTGFRCVS